jgi:hypothetical protein
MPQANGSPFLFDGFATGALWRPADVRNFDMRRLPGVARLLRVGYPANDEHLKEHVWTTYNQGNSPSCVCHMTAGLMSTNEHIERNGQQMLFDAMALHLETGPAGQGRFPGDILKVAQERGVALAGSSKRYRIGSYAYAPTTSPEEWVDTMKAAIASGHVCGIASRLWSNFGAETSGNLLGGETYHEYMLCGYRSTPGVFGSGLIKNSWGSGWSSNGFAWVPFELMVMQNFQDRYLIGNTVIDAIDDDLNPQPQPDPQPQPNPQPNPQPQPQPQPSRVKVYALAAGGGLEMLHADLALSASGGGFQGTLTVERVDRDTQPQPDPQPNPNPQPDPQPQPEPTPGDLTVMPRLFASRGGYNLFVYVTGPVEGAAVVTVQSTAQVWIVRNQATLDGRLPATAAVRGATAGTTVRCIAEAGGLRGEATVSAPGVSRMDESELPPMIDET